MTDKATLLALAERVEGLDGPDRELGREVLRACGWTQSTHGYFLGPLTGWTSPDRAIYFDDDDFVRGRHDPTASLDAAMSLVPEGDGFTVGQNVHHGHWVASVNYLDSDGAPQSRGCSNACRTGPLALCAAALRARAETLP